MELRDKTLRNAREAVKKKRGTSKWLQRNLSFNHGANINVPSESLECLLDELLKEQRIYKRDEWLRDLRILLANLVNRKTKPIAISLNENSWTKSKYRKAGRLTIELVRMLNNQKYLDMKSGYHTDSESRLTRIWSTDKLLEYLEPVSPIVTIKPVELVELRDWKGKLIEYKDTTNTYRIRQILEQANRINEQADIMYHSYKLNPYLVAIFKERFTQYGRLHTRGYRHYQGFSEKARKQITINGDPVVELDYSALHPFLLYAEKGIQYDGDPYTVIYDDTEARNFLKHILLCMLNSKDEITAERAANYWLKNEHDERELLKEIGITRARPLIDGFKQHHQPIAEYFCQGKKTGMRIMNKDAQIALDVVNHFAKQGIPILAVHDSFIVQEQHRMELRNTMQRIYQKHTGDFRCKIK